MKSSVKRKSFKANLLVVTILQYKNGHIRCRKNNTEHLSKKTKLD